MTGNSRHAAQPIDAGEPLSINTPCVHCGYNLRGLPPTGRCPECGQAVVDSTHGDLLRYADPVWLDTLRKGASLKLWNILFGILLAVGGGGSVMLTGSTIAVLVVGLIGGALGLWATLLITSQEPRVSLDEDPMALRWVIRGCAVASLAGALMPTIGWRLSYIFWGRSVPDAVFIGVYGLLSLAGVVVYFGELVYLRRFARRIPDEKLSKSTTIVLWLLPAGMTLLGLTAVLALMIKRFSPSPPASGAPVAGPSGWTTGAMVFTGCSGVLLMLAMSVWYFKLLLNYRKAFAEAAAYSGSGDPAG